MIFSTLRINVLSDLFCFWLDFPLFHPRATRNLKMNCHREENLIYHTLDFLLKGAHLSVPMLHFPENHFSNKLGMN